MKEIKTRDAPIPLGPYSQGAIADGVLLFIAGQTPKNPKTGAIPGDFRDQAAQCLENVKAIVEAAGGSLADIVKVNAYLKDLSNFQAFNEVYERYFSPPYPARATVGADLPGILLEIEAVASLPRDSRR